MPKTVVEKLVACLDEEIYKDHKMEIEAKKALDRQIAGFAEKESRLIVLFTEGSITQDLYTKKLTEYRQDKKKLEERLSIDEAAEQVKQYYKINPAITLKEQGEKEADEVSARIAKILSTHTFSFSPMEYISIHKALFSGIFDDEIAGKLRT